MHHDNHLVLCQRWEKSFLINNDVHSAFSTAIGVFCYVLLRFSFYFLTHGILFPNFIITITLRDPQLPPPPPFSMLNRNDISANKTRTKRRTKELSLIKKFSIIHNDKAIARRGVVKWTKHRKTSSLFQLFFYVRYYCNLHFMFAQLIFEYPNLNNATISLFFPAIFYFGVPSRLCTSRDSHC